MNEKELPKPGAKPIPEEPDTTRARPEVTQLLRAHQEGESDAMERLVPLIYDHLRRLAHFELRRVKPGKTFDTTVLVHEAYLRLVDREGASYRDRGHFFAASAKAMRHILVDAARRRLAAKRGGGQEPTTLDEGLVAQDAHALNVLAVDEAMERLGALDERLCRVVECRFFAGLTEEETAEVIGVSARTVHRDWLRARGWLRRHLGSGKT